MRIVTAAGMATIGLLALAWSPAQAQDAAAGQKVFGQCRSCHQVGPTAKNGLGPELNGVIGRKAGTVAGYAYSPAMKSSGIVWTPEEFGKYIQNPKAVVPGTKMAVAGIKDESKIKDLAAYLETFGPDGKPKS